MPLSRLLKSAAELGRLRHQGPHVRGLGCGQYGDEAGEGQEEIIGSAHKPPRPRLFVCNRWSCT